MFFKYCTLSKAKNYIRDKVIKILPVSSKYRNKLLVDKHLKSLRCKGEKISIRNNINITRSNGLVLGNNVAFHNGISIDATAGVLIGDRSTIGDNVRISTVEIINDRLEYNPIVIGPDQEVKSDLNLGAIIHNNIFNKGLVKYSGQIVFVLSTGRSGSKAIAQLLNSHPDSECYHDTFPHIYKWSCDLLYGNSEKEEIKRFLLSLYSSIDVKAKLVHGQSDQKLAPLVPILKTMFPSAKFIWLIRRPESFISSSYPRGWFDNSEFGFSPNSNEYFQKEVTPSKFDAAHRTNGYLAGNMTEDQWKEMTAFERNCWYWNYWNNYIESQLSLMNKSKWMKVELESLKENANSIFEFLGLSSSEAIFEKVNTATYNKVTRDKWTKEMNVLFDRHCKENASRWYND